MAGQKYHIHFDGGVVVSGVLNAGGQARHESVPKQAQRVEYEPREPLAEQPWTGLNAMLSSAKKSLG